MQLIFEKSRPGRGSGILPESDIPQALDLNEFGKTSSAFGEIPVELRRKTKLNLPEVAETDLLRHYTQLAKRTYGINDGFYPLGSCTMKYNPRIDEEIAGLSGFSKIHPLQPKHTVEGCLEVLSLAEKYLCEITGMDHMTFQPSAGAHGEFTGLLLIKAYHQKRKDDKRRKIIIPDSAHGTNPASAAMAGFEVVNLSSTKEGLVDIEKLKEIAGEDTAGLMLTNPNTLGLFDRNIAQITKIVHDAGGLTYYDGANLNAIMGIIRPGDMGFDVVHLNLHKTFSTPHGGGGPGSGPVGCKDFLAGFLPEAPEGIGKVKAFYGNFLVVVRALAYILTLGREGIPEAAQSAVLSANYLKKKLSDMYEATSAEPAMHEFVLSLADLKKQCGVSALDMAKAILDNGFYPPTMYFPMIIPEALMIEPTETESRETLDHVADVFKTLYHQALENPESLRHSPAKTPVGRLDEVGAARNPRLIYRPQSDGENRPGIEEEAVTSR